MKKKESQNFKLKLKLPNILRSPFSRRGKKKTEDVEEDRPRGSTSSYEVAFAATGVTPDPVASSTQRSDTDDTSSTRDSRTSLDVSTIQPVTTTTSGTQDVGSAEGRVRTLFLTSFFSILAYDVSIFVHFN